MHNIQAVRSNLGMVFDVNHHYPIKLAQGRKGLKGKWNRGIEKHMVLDDHDKDLVTVETRKILHMNYINIFVFLTHAVSTPTMIQLYTTESSLHFDISGLNLTIKMQTERYPTR